MVPFRLTPKQKALLEKIERRQAAVVAEFSKNVQRELDKASIEIANAAYTTGEYRKPDLRKVPDLFESFYKAVITEAFLASRASEKLNRKRLAFRIPFKLAGSFRELEKIFRDRRFWPTVQRRAKNMSEALIAEYLKKSRKRFEIISPLLQTGEVTPKQVKDVMREASGASRALVETRFRTETTTYFATAQRKYYEGNPDIIGFLFDSIRDHSRTDICRDRHGLIYRDTTPEQKALLAYNTPALHYNCRSHLIPLANTSRNREMLAEEARDPLHRVVADLPPGWHGQGTEAKTGKRKR